MNQEVQSGGTNQATQGDLPVNSAKGNSTMKVICISVFVTIIVIAAGAFVWGNYLFPTSFKPVSLSSLEVEVLDRKLQVVNLRDLSVSNSNTALKPEPYSENDQARRVGFSEREVNALLAHNTDMADKLVIDFSPDLASATWLLPLDPEFPILGGKTLKLAAGLELAFKAERPVVKLRGISLWGVPLPNAWLGYAKNIDLVSEFGSKGGFWSVFADGIDELVVEDGQLVIKLKP
jgi:hypothetical protein